MTGDRNGGPPTREGTPRVHAERIALAEYAEINDPAHSALRWKFVETAYGEPLPEHYEDIVVLFRSDPARARRTLGILTSAMLIGARIFEDAGVAD